MIGAGERRRPERDDVRELLAVEIKGGIERRRRQHRLGRAHRRRDRNIGNTLVGSFRLYSASAAAHTPRAKMNTALTSPVEPVRDPAADEHEQHGGNELGEAEPIVSSSPVMS